jgi:hypothetical protein
MIFSINQQTFICFRKNRKNTLLKSLKKTMIPQNIQITNILFAEISFPVPGSASNFVAVKLISFINPLRCACLHNADFKLFVTSCINKTGTE